MIWIFTNHTKDKMLIASTYYNDINNISNIYIAEYTFTLIQSSTGLYVTIYVYLNGNLRICIGYKFRHILVIVHKEFKLMVLCLILLVCCVGCHRAQFWDQLNFVCICFHLVQYLDTIILAITFRRMTPNSTFHLSVRILWNH